MESFGIYVHIPYCLQICTYCDFVKFERHDLPPTTDYVDLLKREITERSVGFERRPLTSIYFGGGTPSLFSPEEILAVMNHLANVGFVLKPSAEVTLEINPGTINESVLSRFLDIGITRFSVGAQTFDESLLKVTGRKHTVTETVETLKMLAQRKVNYSFDLLFGLPGQNLAGVKKDVARALEFSPSHLSAYNLTVPKNHRLNVGRASDDEQAAMFELIENDLADAGIFRYEISNFSKPGFESKHNKLYWSDNSYWGLGVGAHSYIPKTEESSWGVRFWNPPTVSAYQKEIDAVRGASFWRHLPRERLESLKINEALTDFSHTALRSQEGLDLKRVATKFGPKVATLLRERLSAENLSDFLTAPKNGRDERWILSKKGQAMADRVFEALTFLKDDGVEV